MTRVFLLSPPAAEPVRTPLLAFLYLAAALRRAGHEVALLDAAAPFAPQGADEIAKRVHAFSPDLVGIHCKTLQIQGAYALARALRERGVRAPLCAGGPHATALPLEPLEHGFDLSVVGEAEEALVELADALDGKRPLDSVRSVAHRDPTGALRLAPRRSPLRELDALPDPASALDLFDPAWYRAASSGSEAPIGPSGLLSSRGCPAACTFCANQVTGRTFRHHSAGRVLSDLAAFEARAPMSAFSFFDDSFAIGQRRVEELCGALARRPTRVHWTCSAHPAHLDRPVLAAMKAGGCGGIDLGLESGDPEMLRRIGKGVTVERTLSVLADCRALGLRTVLNLMFGWPDETQSQLEATLALIERAAPLCDAFNARGVLVPFPGTPLYEEHHARFGFTGWWLRDPPLAYLPFPARWSAAEVERAYADDPALDRNYFRHTPAMLDLIARGLWAKARATLGAIGRMSGPSGRPV